MIDRASHRQAAATEAAGRAVTEALGGVFASGPPEDTIFGELEALIADIPQTEYVLESELDDDLSPGTV